MRRILARRAVRAPGGLMVAAALVVLSAGVVGSDARFVGFVAVAVATPALVMTDLAERRLPNRIVGSLCGVVVACVALRAALGAPVELATAAIAGAATLVAYGGLALGGGLGMGDAKLASVLVLLLGSISVEGAIAAAVLPFVLATPLALYLVWWRKTPRLSIAFGPWLLAGFWASTAVFARLP